jgi:uncharacterized protein YndB with AHSA1/START domain
MTEPHVPLRLDLSLELPGSPEQVWHAIATADGLSSWFIETELDQHLDGTIRLSMGDQVESAGTVTGWDPPHRFAYVEPDWASLSGHEGASVTPLASEFLVEARSGGTCVVRVVTSAFGSGAEWEREFFADMELGWAMFFENLRLYLAEFAGRRATTLRISTDLPDTAAAVVAAVRRALRADAPGQVVDLRGLQGEVASVSDVAVLVRATSPERGYFQFFGYDKRDGTSMACLNAYLFSPGAAAYIEREQPGWTDWLGALAVHGVSTAGSGHQPD